MFNYLMLIVTCPRCSINSEMEAEFRFGLMDLTRYRIGNKIRWDGQGTRSPQERPKGGNFNGEAYTVCPNCNRDFWLNISVGNDVITGATINTNKQPYIPNKADLT